MTERSLASRFGSALAQSTEDRSALEIRLVAPLVIDIHNCRTHPDSATKRVDSLSIGRSDQPKLLTAWGRGAGLSAMADVRDPAGFRLGGVEITRASFSQVSREHASPMGTLRPGSTISYDPDAGAQPAMVPRGSILELTGAPTCRLEELRLRRSEDDEWTFAVNIYGMMQHCVSRPPGAGETAVSDYRQYRYTDVVPSSLRPIMDPTVAAILAAILITLGGVLRWFLPSRSSTRGQSVSREESPSTVPPAASVAPDARSATPPPAVDPPDTDSRSTP